MGGREGVCKKEYAWYALENGKKMDDVVCGSYVRVNSKREHPPPGQTLGICFTMSPEGRAFES